MKIDLERFRELKIQQQANPDEIKPQLKELEAVNKERLLIIRTG